MSKLLKGFFIAIGAVTVSALAIQASDMVQGLDGSMFGLVHEVDDGPCAQNAVLLQLGGSSLCVDKFEASAGDMCVVASPQNNLETERNMLETTCSPVSQQGLEPWRYVSLSEAQQLCARVGKRLPTNEEWYKIALTLTDQQACNVHSGTIGLSGDSTCMTSAGIFDLVGNVWEWVDASVRAGEYDSVVLPNTGFISLVDNNGLVLETTSTPVVVFGEDYAWTTDQGVTGVIRGGFYDSGTDAGIYAQNLSVPFDLRVPGVGFRCVSEPRSTDML